MSTFVDTNRMTIAIDKFERVLAQVPADELAAIGAAATLDHESWLVFGNYPARMLAAGHIDASEALVLHAIHTDFRTTATLAQRMVFMEMVALFGGKC